MILFIIYGTRGITTTKKSGEFFCPMCNSSRTYRHRRVRRVFTLYFIPIMPLDLAGEYIECGSCRGTFKLAVLKHDPRPQMAAYGAQAQAAYNQAAQTAQQQSDDQMEAEFHIAVRRIMVLMMLADGWIDPGEMVMVKDVFHQITGRRISDATIEQEVEAASRSTMDIQHYLRSMMGYLNEHGKEMIVKAALLVAAADGDFAAEEREMVHQIGSGLRLSKARVNQLTTELVGEA